MNGAWLALAVACSSPPRAVTTIPGVQVVAIEATPPQPTIYDELTLDTWVADGIGRGTEVLTWVCTPVDGLCAEGSPPGLFGVPFEQWTDVSRADPRSTTTNKWPVFRGLVPDDVELPEGIDDGGLLVWALACVPGFCPIMEEVQVDSAPGSEPWLRVAEGLADPARWVKAAPEGYASVAVKWIPMWDPEGTTEGGDTEEPLGRNHAPILTEDETSARPLGTWPPQTIDLGISEKDGDLLQARTFATSGLIRHAFEDDDTGDGTGGDTIQVLWAPRASDGGRPPQLFLVVEDERGATDVWSSDDGAVRDPCDASTEVTYTSPAYPGDGLLVGIEPGGDPLDAAFDVVGSVSGVHDFGVAISFEIRAVDTGELLASSPSNLMTFDGATCTATFDRAVVRDPMLEMGLCSYGGRLVDVQATVTDNVVVEEEVELVASVLATATAQAVVEIDPDLPCAQ